MHAVHGVVERFGRAAIGPEGWRAECVLIRALLCADDRTAALLRATYPGVPVATRAAWRSLPVCPEPHAAEEERRAA